MAPCGGGARASSCGANSRQPARPGARPGSGVERRAHHRSVASNQAPASHASRASTSSGRFTAEERRSFGRWSFLAASSRCFAPLPLSAAPQIRYPGQVENFVACDDTAPAAAHRAAEARRPSTPTRDSAQIREVLERMLPAGVSSDARPEVDAEPTPALLGGSEPQSPQAGEALSSRAESVKMGGIGGNGEVLNRGAPGKWQKEPLERFRRRILQHFLSLHDAFSRLNHAVSRDKALTCKEFHRALESLGVGTEGCDEIFDAMDSRGDGGVTLSEFLHALVDISPEALLWELRCRLLRVNIGPHNLEKALELVRWPQHGWLSRATKLKRRCTRKSCACCNGEAGKCDCKAAMQAKRGGETGLEAVACVDAAFPGVDHETPPGPPQPPENRKVDHGHEHRTHSRPTSAARAAAHEEPEQPRKRPSQYHLTRGDWLKFCTSMYMTLLEAERLWLRLADARNFVDLREMFEILRKTVEPDITLERFVVKACQRYDNLNGAFTSFAEDRSHLPSCPERLLFWQGFHRLAVALHVNDANAAELWRVLTGALETRVDSFSLDEDEAASAGEGVTWAAFERELSLWAPETALGTLKENLCNRFGSLGESHRVLQRHLHNVEELSPREFESRLRAAGIKQTDVNRALSTLANRDGAHVSLEAAIHTMRAMKTASRTPRELAKCSETAVRNQTQHLWDTLRDVQKDCQRRYDEGDELAGSKLAATMALLAQQDRHAVRELVADKQHKFTESIRGAVQLSKSFRAKSVLHQAHRQVINLEKRWAATVLRDGAPSPAASGRGRPAPPQRAQDAPRRNSAPTVGVSRSAPTLLVPSGGRANRLGSRAGSKHSAITVG